MSRGLLSGACSVVAWACLWCSPAAAHEGGDAALERIAQALQKLEARLADLEKQVQDLRAAQAVAPTPAPPAPAPLLPRRWTLEDEVKEFGDNPGPVEPSGLAVKPDAPLQPGQMLHVQWGSSWWLCRVVELLDDGQVKIHYLGWSEIWDEVVPRERLNLLNVQ